MIAFSESKPYILTENTDAPLQESRQAMQELAQGAFYELLSPDGIHFLHFQRDSPEKSERKFLTGSSFVQFCFSVQNSISFRNEDHAHEVSVDAFSYNILKIPAGETTIHWRENQTEIFLLNILPTFLARYAPENHPLRQRYEDSVSADTVTALSDFNLPLTPKVRSILFDILQCPLDQQYKRLYLRAKLVELLLLVLSQHEEFLALRRGSFQDLEEEDIARMQLARNILHQNLQNPCSLIDLAHQVGTNDNYLKKHFKQVFGQTVFGYVTEVRMQEARRMISNEELPLSEVARRSGYKHTQHFISAYKKFFGYAPTTKS